MTTWGVYIDWERNDDFDDAIDSIWSDVVSLKWRLGIGRAYRSIADESICTIEVRNTDGKYNPENSSSPLYGLMLPQRLVKITATDGEDTLVMWRGWVARIEPKWYPAGAYSGQTLAVIHCIGAKDLLQSAEINLPLQQDKRGDEIIAEVLRRVVLPPAVSGGWLIGKMGYSELGISSRLASDSEYSDLETGRLIFHYYGDVRGVARDEGSDGYRIIRDVTDAERGRFFFGRDGRAYWWNQDHLLDDVVDDGIVDTGGTLGIPPARLQYAYGASVANHIQVRAYPRSAGSTITLWSLDNPITIPAGGSIQFDAPFTDDNRRRAGALDASTENIIFSSGSADVSIECRAERAIVTLTNSGSIDAVLSGMDIEGQVLTAHNQVVIEQEDADSILNYGRREEFKLSLRALDDLSEAIDIAQFELERRKTPRGEIGSLSFINEADGIANADQLAWTIGTRLRVVADELYHDESYFVIGEQHQVSAGGGVHETTFILEPAIFDRMTYHARQNLNTGTALNGSDAKSCLTQGFQVAQDGDIGRIRLRLKKVGSPAGSLTLKLFSDKAYTDTWELGETGKSELGVFTKLLPDGGTSVPYDLETEATFVDAGSVSSGTTFTHTANCEIWYEADALAATDMRVIFRKQDSSNNWFVFIGSTGNLILFERIAGTANNRGSAAAGTVTAGAIIRIIASGSTIQAYVNGVLKINYASASNFATATNGEVTINGAGGVIKDLVAHRLAAAAVSELAEVSEHTDRLSGSVSAGTDFAHEANARLLFTVDALPSSGDIQIQFRKQNNSNLWLIQIFSNGAFNLYEYVSAAATLRASTGAGVVTNNSRMQIVCHMETITIEVNGVQIVSYDGAVNFKTEILGRAAQLGTGGKLSDVVTYPYPGNAAGLETDYRWIDFVFDPAFSLMADTPCWLRLETTDDVDASHYVLWGADEIMLDYAGGEMKYRRVSGWMQELKDAVFEVYAA